MLPALRLRASVGDDPYAGSRAVSLPGGCAAGNSFNCFCRDAIGGNFVQARICIISGKGTAPGAGAEAPVSPLGVSVYANAAEPKTAMFRFPPESIHSFARE